jgi:hypothetical protein
LGSFCCDHHNVVSWSATTFTPLAAAWLIVVV